MALIGFASKPVCSAVPNACDNYIGGPLVNFDSVQPPPTILHTCQNCQTPMCFFGHIYCPLSNSSFHRTLCLFVCLRPGCQEKGFNWRVLRSQCVGVTQKLADNQEDRWCLPDEDNETADSWGCGDEPVYEVSFCSLGLFAICKSLCFTVVHAYVHSHTFLSVQHQ